VSPDIVVCTTISRWARPYMVCNQLLYVHNYDIGHKAALCPMSIQDFVPQNVLSCTRAVATPRHPRVKAKAPPAWAGCCVSSEGPVLLHPVIHLGHPALLTRWSLSVSHKPRTVVLGACRSSCVVQVGFVRVGLLESGSVSLAPGCSAPRRLGFPSFSGLRGGRFGLG
jgi:hypothetical protein